MPRRDGTGPLGGGPQTGGGFGNCAGQNQLGRRGAQAGARNGRGINCSGRRMGVFGWGRTTAAQDPDSRDGSILSTIRAELDQVKQQLAQVLGRLKG
jgi:hypothetical protein